MLARIVTITIHTHSCNRNIFFLTMQYVCMKQFESYLSRNNNNSPNIPGKRNTTQKTRENL